MKQYKYTKDDADNFSKYGVDLTVYNEGVESANVVYVSCTEGHFEEFMDTTSHYLYQIISGKGVFVIDDEEINVKPKDLIVIPPNTKVYYFGTMEMILVVSPRFNEETRVHIRDVDPSENPLKEDK